MAVRHMGKPKATHDKNRLHEVFLGGSKLTFISNSKRVCVYGGEGSLFVNVYNIFSNSTFYWAGQQGAGSLGREQQKSGIGMRLLELIQNMFSARCELIRRLSSINIALVLKRS